MGWGELHRPVSAPCAYVSQLHEPLAEGPPAPTRRQRQLAQVVAELYPLTFNYELYRRLVRILDSL